MSDGSSRVAATPAAVEAIRLLVADRGRLMFVQSGGCCDGSAPMCFEAGEYIVGPNDVHLGDVEGCPVYIDVRQYSVWKDSTLTIDVGRGEPEGFSLPAGDGLHFITRSGICATDGNRPAT